MDRPLRHRLAAGGTHDQELGALLPCVRPVWVQSLDRRLNDDFLGTVGTRIVLHVGMWQRSARSSLAASILAADRRELAGQPEKPKRPKQRLFMEIVPFCTLKQIAFGIRGLSAATIEALYRRGLLEELEIHERPKIPTRLPLLHKEHVVKRDIAETLTKEARNRDYRGHTPRDQVLTRYVV